MPNLDYHQKPKARRLAQTPAVWCLRSRRDVLFRPRAVASILSCAMPFYHRVYSPAELQFITTSTYRHAPLFLSDRLRRCFVQRLDEVGQELDSMHNNPVTRGLVSSPGEWPWSSWRFYYLQDASILRMDRMG